MKFKVLRLPGRVRFVFGNCPYGYDPPFLSVGLKAKLFSFWAGYREFRLTLLGLDLHWRTL